MSVEAKDAGHLEELKENLLRIGQEKFFEYKGTVFNEMVGQILADLKRDVENEPTDDQKREIEEFLADPEKDSRIEQIFDKRNVDLGSLLKGAESEEDKIKSVNAMLIKDGSFDRAVQEQHKEGVVLEGFEEDSDFVDLDGILKKVFSNGLLDKCLISKIVYHSDLAYVDIGGSHFYLPLEKYKEWKKIAPEVQEFKFRAGNFEKWNTKLHLTPEFTSLPIAIFSFDDEDLDKFDYLGSVSDEEKMRLYKLGTVFHEAGHNLYTNLVGAEERQVWRDLVDQYGNLTYYSAKYTKGMAGAGSGMDYGEEFAEAVRLLVATPEYLRDKFPGISDFLKDKFPKIKSL